MLQCNMNSRAAAPSGSGVSNRLAVSARFLSSSPLSNSVPKIVGSIACSRAAPPPSARGPR
jgi:hypothetical protein